MPTIVLKRHSIRTIMIAFSYGSFILATAYNSNLKAIYSVSKHKSRPESLSEALEDSAMQFIVCRGTSEYSLLGNSKAGLYYDAWQRIIPYPQNIIDITDLQRKGFEKIETSKKPLGVFYHKDVMSRYIASKPASSVYIVKEPLLVNLGGMVYKKRFRFADIFNEEIKRLQETGME